ncbi:MAG: hypothetical protein HOC20_14655 [Chloroflexi bacterium]|jgi:hypothetical protein|nr:hypothetical protein [Chloroflexota bacterium]
MARNNYYLLTSLSGLGDLGSVPPMPLAGLLEKVIDSGGNHVLLEALFLGGDLLQRQALLSSEIEEAEPTVLTLAQVRDQEPLPEYLVSDEAGIGTQSALDVLWGSYYSYVASVAVEYKSEFLFMWVEYEIGMRNALVMARAKSLNLDPQEYLVAPWIGGAGKNFSGVINEWVSASDPFVGLRVLDEARWKWLGDNDGWFTFSDDELVAYGAKLMLLHRWHRLGREVPVQVEKAVVAE